MQWEEIAVHGMSGTKSAKEFLLPKVAESVGTSDDLCDMRLASGIRRGVGWVGLIRFPFSREQYKHVMKLLATQRFKIHIPLDEEESKFHTVEITLAMNTVELAKVLAWDILQPESASLGNGGDDDKVEALELRIQEGALRYGCGCLTRAGAVERTASVGAG